MIIRIMFVVLCVLVLPAQAQTQTTVRYIHTDVLGSVVAVTDENRNVIERREYEPFGAQLTPALSDGPGYTGHVQDAATGLTYMQQRYYDPQIGRFLSVDPVTADGNTGGNFNRYWYANNNPYRFTDPDGRQADEIGAWARALWDNDGDFEKAGEQVDRQHAAEKQMLNVAADFTAVGIVKDAVEVSVKVANGEDATGQGAGAVVGEVAGQVAETYLDGKIGDGAAATVGAAVGKATGDTVQTVVDNSRGGTSSGGSAATQPEPVKPPEPLNLRDK